MLLKPTRHAYWCRPAAFLLRIRMDEYKLHDFEFCSFFFNQPFSVAIPRIWRRPRILRNSMQPLAITSTSTWLLWPSGRSSGPKGNSTIYSLTLTGPSTVRVCIRGNKCNFYLIKLEQLPLWNFMRLYSQVWLPVKVVFSLCYFRANRKFCQAREK